MGECGGTIRSARLGMKMCSGPLTTLMSSQQLGSPAQGQASQHSSVGWGGDCEPQPQAPGPWQLMTSEGELVSFKGVMLVGRALSGGPTPRSL